jgi:SpoVK/Ycf46/Vps4 family AAA+-type ATPase
MRALSHGASANSLTGIPLSSGVAMLIAGATGAARTVVAESLASDLQRDLFRIDLSAIVSQQIGETEKNLDRILTMAQQAGAVLYIEEGDALFGRRAEVKDSYDRYANLEVSYLLERLESYQGLVILATNTRENIDAAFLRRLRHVVDLPAAGAESGG